MRHHFPAVFLFFTIACMHARAQPIVKAQKKIGGSANDNFTCITRTTDGGLLAGGTSLSDSSKDKTADSRGATDYWIVKLNAAGVIEWDKTIGGSGYDNLRALQQTAEGGYILCGSSNSPASGEKSADSRGFTDYWIVKLDMLGNVEWDKTIGGDYIDEAYSIQQTAGGGYIAGGVSSSPVSGDKTQGAIGGGDYWVVKISSAGNVEWDKNIGGAAGDLLMVTKQTTDGGYILGGYSYSSISGDKTQNCRGNDDYWIVKLNASGAIEWDRTVGGDDYDELTCLYQTGDEGYIIGGTSKSNKSGDKTGNNTSIEKYSKDYWIVQLDKKGNIKSDLTTGGLGDDALRGIEIRDKDMILYGFSNSWVSGDKTDPELGAWLVGLSKNGSMLWDETIPVLDPIAIAKIKNNEYAIGSGYFYNVRNSDYLISDVRFTNPGITPVHNKIADKNPAPVFTVYPNPAINKINIRLNGKGDFLLSNLSGKILLKQTITGSGTMQLANVPAGTYYLTNRSTGITQKIIITK